MTDLNSHEAWARTWDSTPWPDEPSFDTYTEADRMAAAERVNAALLTLSAVEYLTSAGTSSGLHPEMLLLLGREVRRYDPLLGLGLEAAGLKGLQDSAFAEMTAGLDIDTVNES